MKRVVVFIVLAMMVIGSCTAQSATNEAQKLVGTWVDDGGLTLVFNADGTGTLTYSSSNNPHNIFWGVSTSGGLCILGSGEATFFLSPDGRRMIWGNTVFQKR